MKKSKGIIIGKLEKWYGRIDSAQQLLATQNSFLQDTWIISAPFNDCFNS